MGFSFLLKNYIAHISCYIFAGMEAFESTITMLLILLAVLLAGKLCDILFKRIPWQSMPTEEAPMTTGNLYCAHVNQTLVVGELVNTLGSEAVLYVSSSRSRVAVPLQSLKPL